MGNWFIAILELLIEGFIEYPKTHLVVLLVLFLFVKFSKGRTITSNGIQENPVGKALHLFTTQMGTGTTIASKSRVIGAFQLHKCHKRFGMGFSIPLTLIVGGTVLLIVLYYFEVI